MFNLQGSEVVIVLLLALVVLGPEKLPDAMRKAGQFVAEIRKMSSGFQEEFRKAVDEPMNELRQTASTLRDSADFTSLANGERAEKPKSGDMADASSNGSTPDAQRDDEATTERVDADDAGPVITDDTDDSVAQADDEPTPPPANPRRFDVPAPFSGMSSAAPRPKPPASEEIDVDGDE